MSVTVTLFKGISPNYGKHYKFFTSYAEYIDSLGNYYKRYTLTDDRISDNQIIFSAAENVDAAEVSYCYINRNDGNSNKAYYFYHVTSGSVRSGMAFLQLELDVWATYLQRVNFGEIFVERCNRDIFGQGVYPDFGDTNGAPQYTELGGFTATNANLLLCYVVAYTNPAGLLQSAGVTIQFFANRLNTITEDKTTKTRDINDIISAIGSIAKVRWGVGTSATATDAKTLAAFVVPQDMVERAEATGNKFFISNHDNTSEIIQPQFIVNPGIKSKTITISPSETYIQYIGTRGAKVKVPQYTGDIFAQYQFITGVDNISVYVNIGDIKQDLTNQFAMPLIKSENETAQSFILKNGLNAIAETINLNFGKKIKKNFTTINEFTNSGNIQNLATGQDANFQILGGDALSAFYHGDNENFYSPYTLSKYTPLQTNSRIIRNSGAIFNAIYTGTIASIFTNALLGIAPPTSTYIQGDIDCYGAQKDVIDFFVQRFREGVYLEKI